MKWGCGCSEGESVVRMLTFLLTIISLLIALVSTNLLMAFRFIHKLFVLKILQNNVT